jgi:DNA-binding MarR family transcriptional regulator
MALHPTTKMLLCIEELRKLDPEMPAQIMAVFMAVAGKPGTHQREVGNTFGLSSSSASRVFARLSDLPGGLGLLNFREDPQDRRVKVAKLTPKGDRVVRAVTRIMEG